jgi:hypothetical protein
MFEADVVTPACNLSIWEADKKYEYRPVWEKITATTTKTLGR